MEYDAKAIYEWLTQHFYHLLPGEKIEIRALTSGGGVRQARGFFDTPREATEWITTRVDPRLEIYAGVNPRLGNDGTNAGVSRLLYVWADFDFKLFASEAEAMAVLDGFDLPATTINRSGGGMHTYWRLEPPLDAQESQVRFEALQKRLYVRLGGLDNVHDIARILRVPGTYNNKAELEQPTMVRQTAHDSSAVYTIEDFERCVPPTRPDEKRLYKGENLGTPQNPVPLEEARKMLSFISPTLPYGEYLGIWMGIASEYPGSDGLQLIDDWSSQPREDNGQSSSPRTSPNKHYQFRRTTGQISTIGTVIHHAKLGGYMPPEAPRVAIIRRIHEPEYRIGLAAHRDPPVLDLPEMWQRIYDYLGELPEPFSRDFTTGMVAANFSSLLPQVRFQNLNCSLWFLGVAEQSSGKNALSDALYEVFKRVNSEVTEYTSGTAEGMWRELEGDGKQLYCYHREYGGFLENLRKEYMSGAKANLCNLYDGATVAHRLAKTKIEATHPYVTVIGTTTQTGIHRAMETDDLRSGYASRFLIPFTDTRNLSPGFRPTETAARELIALLSERKKELSDIRYSVWDGEVDTEPAAYLDYMHELGIGTGEVRRFEDALNRVETPQGRLLARVKKLATALEAAAAIPQVRGNTIHVREAYADLAVLLTRRWAYGALALYPLVTTGKDEALMQHVVQYLGRDKTVTMTEIVKRTHGDIKEVRKVLDFLVDEQAIETIYNTPGAVPRFRFIGRGA